MLPRRLAVRLNILAGSLLFAGSVAAADLLQVYREALLNDAQYAAARATVEAGREKLPQGLAGLLPTIGATANTVWNENEYSPRNLPSWSRDFNSNSWNVNLTGSYSLGKIKNGTIPCNDLNGDGIPDPVGNAPSLLRRAV